MKRERKQTISLTDAAKAKEVRDHFLFTDEQHFDLVVDMGETYIRSHLNWSASGKEALRRSKVFWGWFYMRWVNIDLMFHDDLGRYPQDASIYIKGHRRHLNCKLPNFFWRELTIKINRYETEVDA